MLLLHFCCARRMEGAKKVVEHSTARSSGSFFSPSLRACWCRRLDHVQNFTRFNVIRFQQFFNRCLHASVVRNDRSAEG